MGSKTCRNTIVPSIIAALALVPLISSPAWAKSQKKSVHSSAATAAAEMGPVPQVSPAPKTGQHDTKPGPAWKTVGGTVKDIQGNMYTLEDYEGNQMKVHVGQGTKHLRGNKRVGDSIRAEITRGGFANSIQ
jgi:hypothetical protein